MSSSAQIVAVGCVNAIEQLRIELSQARSRVAELTNALRVAEEAMSGAPFHLPRIVTRAEEDALALARATLEKR